MLKKILSALLFVIVLFLPGHLVSAQDNAVKVYIDDVAINFDVNPQIVNGRTMVPLRFIAEELKATVKWDASTNGAVLTRGEKTVKVTIGRTKMLVNDFTVNLDTPPIMENGRILVPLRAIAESFEIQIDWNQAANAVIISTPNKDFLLANFTKKYSLLNGRLNADLPEFAADNAVYYGGLMGYEGNDSKETRITMEKNGAKLVLYLSELFMESSGNMLSDGQELLLEEGAPGSLVVHSLPGKAEKVIITPEEYEISPQTCLREAIIKTADNLLVYAAVLTDSETLIALNDCEKIADFILENIEAGDRKLNRSARTISNHVFTMQLKEDYGWYYFSGIDFDVYYAEKIIKPGEFQPYLGIYSGGHPSFSEYPEDKTTLSGTIAGQKIFWYNEDNASSIVKTDSLFETLVQKQGYGYLNIWARPRNDSAWKEIREMSETIVLVDGMPEFFQSTQQN
ncbi:MAG: copper amine oxidase N-terminal domain-containing protein [Clostridiales bacterium]|jgi:hypothetical protein|nr:copper amine oxidase N-terminal domain-containing protein [Clostridiales bacterium]